MKSGYRKRLAESQVAELRRLRLQGTTIEVCVEQLGASLRLVTRALKEHGLTGTVCPSCGYAIPSGQVGKPKPRGNWR